MTGLVNPNYGFGGLDGSIHLAEDCINATTVVPLATIFSILTAVITALFFAVSMLYCISDIESVLSTRTGQVLKRSQIQAVLLTANSIPLYEIIAQATRSKAATTVFMALMTSVAFLTLIGSVLAASKITWSLARDEALILSKFVKKIDRKQGVPVLALCFNALWIGIIGCIYLGSSTGTDTVSQPHI